jgi:hypothetical protein
MNLSFGIKIGASFACVMLGVLVVGFTGISALKKLQKAVEDNDRITDVRRMMYDTRLAATRYLGRYQEAEAVTEEIPFCVRMGGGAESALCVKQRRDGNSHWKRSDQSMCPFGHAHRFWFPEAVSTLVDSI